MKIDGSVDEISRRRIVGWAFDSDIPEANLPVAIYVDDREFGRCTADLFRQGLKEELGGGATGQYGFEFTFDPPLSVFKEYRIRVGVADQSEPLPNGVRTLPRPARRTVPLTTGYYYLGRPGGYHVADERVLPTTGNRRRWRLPVRDQAYRVLFLSFPDAGSGGGPGKLRRSGHHVRAGKSLQDRV